MSKNTYWLGTTAGSRRVGTVRIDGKKYGIGDVIPIDKVDSKKAKQWGGSGAIGGAPLKSATKSEKNQLSVITTRAKELEKSLEAAVARIKVLEAAGGDEHIVELEEALEAADGKIVILDESIVDLTADKGALEQEEERLNKVVLEGRGLVETLTAEIEDLNVVKEEFDVLKAKVIALDSEAKAVMTLKEEVKGDG